MEAEKKEREIKAMIQLLDDPDRRIHDEIKSRLLNMGQPVIPYLEAIWENTFNHELQTKIENIIQAIQFDCVLDDLNYWAQNGGSDLLEGAIIVARYQYPDLNDDQIRRQIDLIKKDVWLELNPNLTAYEKVRVINHILFEVHGFSGNTTNYHAPQNSYINNVLDQKKGNPLLLCLIYSIIAQSLNIPIYGVNLPEHFILAYRDEFSFLNEDINEEPILFYINPFSKGAVFSRRDIDEFLKNLKLEPRKIYYETCSNIDIISRLIRNLINSYKKLGYSNKVEELSKMLENIQLFSSGI
jgi:regulator of sirC expression with transglutaminase-like and TPR domain